MQKSGGDPYRGQTNETFFSIAVLIILTATFTSCSTRNVCNRNSRETVFSDIETDYALIDLNNYGCEPIDLTVLEYILENGTFDTEKDVTRRSIM